MEHQVLYRKYRSSNFAQVIGQEHIKPILIESIKRNSISHAYLFSGPRGTGKTSIARLMAQAVNCLKFSEVGDVCNECQNCLLIAAKQAVDIIEMDAASNRGIEEIRQLKDSINYVPSNLKYKVYIIDEAHMLTKDAFNALLKTLEEPPSHALFILATTEPHKIPITIISRVQRYDFNLASKVQLADKLSTIVEAEGYEIDNDGLDLMYKFSGGSFRDAESILGKILSQINDKKITTEIINSTIGVIDEESIKEFIKILLAMDLEQALICLDDLVNKSIDLGVFVDQVITEVRNMIFENLENNAEITKLSGLIREFVEIRNQMRLMSDKLIALQIGIINICSQKSITNYELREKQEKKVGSMKYEVGNQTRNHKSEEPKETTQANTIKKILDPVRNDSTQNSESKAQSLEPIAHSKTANSKLITQNSQLKHSLAIKLGEINKSLQTIMEESAVEQVENKIIIKNGYPFKLKKLQNEDNAKIIKQILDKLIGGDFILSFQPDKSLRGVSETASLSGDIVVEHEDNSDIVEDFL